MSTAMSLSSGAFDCGRLQVRKLTGSEGISRLFRFDVEVVCFAEPGPMAASMLGAEVTIELRPAEPGEEAPAAVRRVHGMVIAVRDLLAAHRSDRVFRLTVAPRAHRLTLVEMQDVFLDATVPSILGDKLARAGLTGADVAMRLEGSPPKRDFVVQYKESDLAFVSRLAEHAGISFYFEHEDDLDRLVFTNFAQGFGPAGEPPVLPFRDTGAELSVFALEADHALVPSRYVVSDYDYRKPLVDLTATHTLAGAYEGAVIEYGTHHRTQEEGRALSAIRAEERQTSELVYTGRSAVPALAAGHRFRLAEHPDMEPVDLLVVEVTHEAMQVVGMSGVAGERSYVNAFRAVPANRTYRPPRVTPRPRIGGLVTGIIQPGPLGQGKHARVDDQGRYWVRLLFDATAPDDRPASHPVRMLQNHVGESYGTHFPLKPGVEVLVAFLDGDPDRPLIVGAVPNPIKPSPVTSTEPGMHRTRTATGVTVEMK
jgi:type VI secretion system secreted protein VgrG